MTRALSDMLAGLNAVFAFFIVLGGGYAGWHAYRFRDIGAEVAATILGLGVGMLVAAAVCGTLATLILIENHLHNLLVMAEREPPNS
ncbi:MAG: hypothetical protein E5W15_12160 [Mesorhizobium sp.]|uniref:hypothetical protein n=1 Tax=unclassified Mesorhizobium TaxID=325217 RepID=UPI000FCB61C1|nr:MULTISPECIES: hypothetical protein [unclassified Mesorhizobium]RUW42995.1 hypothetical protein EOA37_02245 [Mesorhizobium sp. M2A.F.Ca.ET.015.02.1.1]RVC93058.1 hypothetical protein EN739_22935 [Mesorhizobium sp. M2A.F.Ca.ET.017.03.2.1]RVD02553.1 hypothetical protein EN753_22625 [Mesorhizobium sp. M2A.F.Ca.ET.029.05.1.1]RWB47583.1 MAG: hypothetical protein EOQ46_05995 [Mesorhizobium sp.]RWB62085.1 MAG: hypothetical protein EOQ48_11700 [Mesorhizobium sp.]